MKLLPLFLLASAICGATTIQFESLSTTFAPSYTEGGVTFTAVTGAGLRGVTSQNGSIGMLGLAPPYSLLKAALPGNTKFVSVGLGDVGSDADNLLLRIYDSGNNLLGSTQLTIASSNNILNFLSLSSSTDIAYAIFGSESGPNSDSSITADEFTYSNQSPVPEPASMLLSATALLLLWSRNRKHSAR